MLIAKMSYLNNLEAGVDRVNRDQVDVRIRQKPNSGDAGDFEMEAREWCLINLHKSRAAAMVESLCDSVLVHVDVLGRILYVGVAGVRHAASRGLEWKSVQCRQSLLKLSCVFIALVEPSRPSPSHGIVLVRSSLLCAPP